MRFKRTVAALAVAAGMAASGLVAATPASADMAGADCGGSGAFVCLYYSPRASGYGAVFKQGGDIANYSGYTFSCSHFGCSGAGQPVRNNAAAMDSSLTVGFTVYYSVNYDCSYSCQSIPAYGLADLNGSMRNNNASGRTS
ncbi:hypothetical protein ACFV1L_15190 [Kitasatospora sp. NPDC059646]|uniref:hypothetical protein n=1 Tax=Kitasatospora sp. NPDC059646 TaxID=3346893 RepID=UPI0036A326E6